MRQYAINVIVRYVLAVITQSMIFLNFGLNAMLVQNLKLGFRWTRLPCKRSRKNEIRLQLRARANDLVNYLRVIELPEEMSDLALTGLQLKLIKLEARVVRRARAIMFQLAKVAFTGPVVRAILAAIRRLRAPPSCA